MKALLRCVLHLVGAFFRRLSRLIDSLLCTLLDLFAGLLCCFTCSLTRVFQILASGFLLGEDGSCSCKSKYNTK